MLEMIINNNHNTNYATISPLSENIYIYGSLLPSTGIIFLLLTVVNVLEDLYNLMDEATDKAENRDRQSLNPPTTRPLRPISCLSLLEPPSPWRVSILLYKCILIKIPPQRSLCLQKARLLLQGVSTFSADATKTTRINFIVYNKFS